MIKFNELHDTLDKFPKGIEVTYMMSQTHKVKAKKDGDKILIDFIEDGMNIGTLSTPSYKFAAKHINAFFARIKDVSIVAPEFDDGASNEEPQVS